eukprot:scaffold158855_cov21-Tisochrysis_lutea.AAC.1
MQLGGRCTGEDVGQRVFQQLRVYLREKERNGKERKEKEARRKGRDIGSMGAHTAQSSNQACQCALGGMHRAC